MKNKMRPTWVFSCGIYRSGSTTHYQMVRDVVESAGLGVGIGYHEERKLVKHDDTDHKFIVCKVFEFLPGGFGEKSSYGQTIHREGRLKALATIRDPRDVITSMRERHKRQMEAPRDQAQPFSFEDRATKNFPIWLGQLDKWISLGPDICMMSRYEEWTKDLVGEVFRIANHLEIDIDGETVERIASMYTKGAIMDRKARDRKARRRSDPKLPGIPDILFGEAGAHREYLNAEEETMLVDANRAWMDKYEYLELRELYNADVPRGSGEAEGKSMANVNPVFDTRVIAQVQLARVAQGERVQHPIMKYPDDESKVWVLSTDGYVLIDKQEIANAYKGFLARNTG